MASNEQVAVMFAAFQANWNKETVTREQMQLYARILVDIPDAVLEAATLDILATSTWFPKVAEVRAAAFRLMQNGTGLPSAGEAWGEVAKQMLRTGSYGSPEFSHPIIKKAVAAVGGWMALCMSFDQMADRAHFLKIYDVLAQRETQQTLMLPEVREVVKRLSMDEHLRLEAGNEQVS